MSSPAPSPATSVRGNWPHTFQVPWTKVPPGLRSAIANGKRPSPADRRQMVRVVVDDMRKYEANPTRAQCLIIANDIVKQYPQSFGDTMDDGRTMIGGGYSSLLSQIKIRVEHINRNNTLARHRTPRDMTGAKPNCGPADSYGCTRWQPELPPEETQDTQEEMKQRMVELFSREGLSGVERGEVQKLMEKTYYLQRQMVNATPAPSLEFLRLQWPYLFIPRSMCAHFELLTDIPIVRKIEASLEEHGRIISEFFKQKPTNDEVKAVLSRNNSVTAPYILQLLMAHFKEQMDSLIVHADVSISQCHSTMPFQVNQLKKFE